MVEGYSTEDSLLLSSAEAVNDNISEDIQDLRDDIFRFQAMADAHPEVDYNNTLTNFQIPYEDILEESIELQERYQSIVTNVIKSRKLGYVYDEPGKSSDRKWKISERRSNLHTNLADIYSLYREVKKEVNESSLEIKSETPSSV